MSSQANIPGSAGSGGAGQGALGAGPTHFAVYPSVRWQAAWQRLEKFQTDCQRLLLLVGDPGTGKSTMLERLANALTSNGKSVARLRGAQVERHDFLHLAAVSLGLDPDGRDPQVLEARLREHLTARSAHQRFYLLVDEADMLGPSAIASLLRLANIPLPPTTPGQAPDFDEPRLDKPGLERRPNAAGVSPPLRDLSGDPTDASDESRHEGLGDHSSQAGFYVVLAAPTRLLDMLDDCQVDTRNSSIVAIATLGALVESEIHGYLVHRLACSGETNDATISTEAAKAILRYSRGIPRIVNSVAARLLFEASQCGSRSIGPDDVVRVAGDLQSEGLLDTVPPIVEPALDGIWGLPAGDPGPEADRDLEAAIDESVAALIVPELDVEQFGGNTGPSPQSAAATPIPQKSAPTQRRVSLLVPSFTLIVVVFALVVGWRLWNQTSPSYTSTDPLPQRSDEAVATAGSEATRSPGNASVPTATAPVSLGLQPTETLPVPQREGAVDDSAVALGRESPPRPFSVRGATESSAEDTVASLPTLRGPASTEPEAAIVRDERLESTAGVVDQTQLDSPRIAAVPGGVATQGVDSDLAQPVETPEALALVAAESEPVLVAAPKPVPVDERIWSSARPAIRPSDAPEALAFVADESEPVLLVVPKPVPVDERIWSSARPAIRPSDAPEVLAFVADESEPVLLVVPKPVPVDERIWSSARPAIRPSDAPEVLAFVADESEPVLVVAPKPVPVDERIWSIDRTATPEPNEPLADLPEKLDPGLEMPPKPVPLDQPVPSADTVETPPGEGQETLASVSDKLDAPSVVPASPGDGSEDLLSVVRPEASSTGSGNASEQSLPGQGRSAGSESVLSGEEATTVDGAEPPELVAADQRVDQLLSAARIDLQNKRLTKPQGNNAFERYRSVLDIAPENSQALEGLEAIVISYVALAERASADGRLDRALTYLDSAETVLPDDPRVAGLRRQIRDDLGGTTERTEGRPPPESPPESGPLPGERMVMLPVKTNEGCAWPFDQHMIGAVRNVMQRGVLAGLELSAPGPASTSGGQQEEGFWLGSGQNGVPDEQRVYRYGKRVKARWVLLPRVDCPTSASVFEPWRDFQLHLFDVERGVWHQRVGTLAEIDSITEQVLLTNIAAGGG